MTTWAMKRARTMSPPIVRAWRIGRPAVLVATTAAFAMTLALSVLSGYQQVRTETELERYRFVMADLANSVRAMRAKAMAQRRLHELRIDADRGVIYISAIPGRQRAYAALEQAVWLPEGLTISEAPRGVVAYPDGMLTPASLVMSTPVHRRLFRLTTTAAWLVELHEEPTS